MYRSCSDAYDVLNPLDSSSVSIISNHPLADRTVGHLEENSEEDDGTPIPPEFYKLGLFRALRFRYKHAIVCDHVSPPGEAYIDFLCVGGGSRRAGLGSRLLRWAEQSAEKLGCGRIALSVWGLDQEAQQFYERLGNAHFSNSLTHSIGYKLTDQRSDFLARFVVQLIFLSRSHFYDFEKPVGQEQGRAVYASDYGFTSDRVSELDGASRHGTWTTGRMALSDLMNNSMYLLRPRENKSSNLPALASTPENSQPIDSSNKPDEADNLMGSERRHHLQLSTLNRPSDPLILNSQREKLFKQFQEEPPSSDTFTPPIPPPPAQSPPQVEVFRMKSSQHNSPPPVMVGNVLHDKSSQ